MRKRQNRYSHYIAFLFLFIGFAQSGWAISFWNDSTSNSHQEIKAAFDTGEIEYFGMTSGSSPDNRTEGFSEWIQYGLQENPDMKVFIEKISEPILTQQDSLQTCML
ncbi:MAG: hypothetical protein DA445_04710 [Bacteroidetes bacterium]|nr:MAG: hypothetical protein DA445_04710 [Bacteroidota bacterium]PTM17935.1 MAG: hypothetical protein DA444_05220 [Bacteroidota bacterium]